MQAKEELDYLESLLSNDYFALREAATNLNVVLYFLARRAMVPERMSREEFERVVHRETEGHVLDNMIPLVEEYLDWKELKRAMERVKELHYRAEEEGELEYGEVKDTFQDIRKLIEVVV